MFEKLRKKRETKDAAPEVAKVREGGRKFRIKVRLYDGHGAGQVRKFNIFVKPEHGVMEKTEQKIRGLFKS